MYYVVKVPSNRDSAAKDDKTDDESGMRQERDLHERFMKEDFASQFFPYVPSAYQSMAQYPQHQIDLASARRAAQQFRIDWEENAPIRPRR